MKNYTFCLKIISAVFITAIGSGCASTAHIPITNLTPAYLEITPEAKTYQDPGANLSQRKTFSVFPYSLVTQEESENSILESQILFFLRTQIEMRGYKFVEMEDGPDFIATINVSSEQRQSYVPPRTVSLPRWVPGRTVTTHTSRSGRFNYETDGLHSSSGWGNYSGSSTSTTYIPGYSKSEQYTQPGYTVSRYHPSAVVTFYDRKTLQRIWFGTGSGISSNSDVRVSSQFVINRIMTELPVANSEREVKENQGVSGVMAGIYTNDGNNYYPTITMIANKGPAKRAGIKVFDMIVSIDGRSLANKSYQDVASILSGPPGTTANLTIWRNGKEVPVRLSRVSSDKINW